MGSRRDDHRLPFPAHGLLRAEIWQGKMVALPPLDVCYCSVVMTQASIHFLSNLPKWNPRLQLGQRRSDSD